MSLADLAASAEKVVEQVDQLIVATQPVTSLFVGTIPLVGPEINLAEQIAHLLAPHIEAILLAVSGTSQQPIQTIAAKMVDQITPGLPNHSEFNPKPAATT